MAELTSISRQRLTGQKDRKTSANRKYRKSILRSHYFTKGHEHLGEARDVLAEQSPFIYPPCSLIFAYFQYWKGRKRTMDKEKRRGVLKSSGREDLLRTLRVDVDIEELEAKKFKDLDEAMAITDVDPQYFSVLNGRVVKEKFSVKEYVEDIREILRARLLAGQETDDCIRIDQQFVEEQRRLDKIKQCYRRYVSGLEEFLSKDHEESMNILNRAENEVKLSREVTERRNQLAREFSQVRLQVYQWEEHWRTVKMCQRFLYQVSPASWRAEHDWIHRTDSGESVISDTGGDLFGRYRMMDELDSLDALIDLFEKDISESGPADLYFTSPKELINVFRMIETQNLNALIHLESLAEPLIEMTLTLQTAEDQIQYEVSQLTNTIDELEENIHKLESRAADLERYANELLETVFRDAICSEQVLRLQVFVQNTYENCVAMDDANLDSFTMMKWIEKTHEELNLQLDTLPSDVVQFCEKEGFQQEMRARKETEEAAKKFELMHRLLASLKRVMEPPMIKKRPLMQRSVPKSQGIKPIPPPPEPTDEELQYLNFFTNYCKYDDFTNYLSQFPDDFDLSFQPKAREPDVIEEEHTEEEEVKDVEEV